MDLRIDNLTKRFGHALAVEIPSLTIRHPEFFTFVGPSGCGKSTMLNLIAGLEVASSGTLHLGERSLDDLPPQKRNVAFVFQSYALYPHRTVFGNLSFPLELAHVPKRLIREKVEGAAAMLGLKGLLDKTPRQLSGGERQRVALGRAIVRDPALFLFDEPLSNLDAPLRAQMRKELKLLHQRLRTTFVYVTHDQDEALSLSDRIAVMNGGRIVQCGSPREIYDAPANTFVASFFGSPPINLLEGRPDPRSGPDGLQVAGCTFRAAAATAVSAGPVTVGIRPEHVQLSREPRPEFRPANVVAVDLHGGAVFVELEVDGVRMLAVDRKEAKLDRGDRVWIRIDSEHVHVFEPHSGARISQQG
jgi:multiple sugar transport system ATP-binding protein